MRICFVSLNAYDLLARRPVPRHCGGAERQQELLARGLAQRGHDVSFVTWDLGQDDAVVHDGITVYKTCPRNAGWPGLRFFAPRWSSLWRALSRADAELYYQQSADALTGQVGIWAHDHERKFVFASASNFDCHPDLPNLSTRRERILFRWGLRSADWCISQTRYQQRMFLEHFACETTVIPSIGPSQHGLATRRSGKEGGILWVGRIDPVKRLEMLLEVAEHCPDIQFHVVAGANQDSQYTSKLEDRARSASNVVFHGRVARVELDRLFQEAVALVCTSTWEGFPNTFLEAWSVGLPVITTVDPDNLIRTHRLGLTSSDTDEMIHHVRELLESNEEYQACTRRCYAYFREHHTVEAVVSAQEKLWGNKSS